MAKGTSQSAIGRGRGREHHLSSGVPMNSATRIFVREVIVDAPQGRAPDLNELAADHDPQWRPNMRFMASAFCSWVT